VRRFLVFCPMLILMASSAFGQTDADSHISQRGTPPVLLAEHVNGRLLAASILTSSENHNFGRTFPLLIKPPKEPTFTELYSRLNPSKYGQPVIFIATVMPGGAGTPTGTVSFYDGSTLIGTSNLNSDAVATLTISTLAAGTDIITAFYNGDANFNGSLSPELYQVVLGPTVSLYPTSLNFGEQAVGTTSSPQTSTLLNIGNATLTIMLITIHGTDRGDFLQSNNCGKSLPVGGSCSISVTFKPSAPGRANGSVIVLDNAPNNPQSLPLTGVGTPACVDLRDCSQPGK